MRGKLIGLMMVALHARAGGLLDSSLCKKHVAGVDLSQFTYYPGPINKGFHIGAFYQYSHYKVPKCGLK